MKRSILILSLAALVASPRILDAEDEKPVYENMPPAATPDQGYQDDFSDAEQAISDAEHKVSWWQRFPILAIFNQKRIHKTQRRTNKLRGILDSDLPPKEKRKQIDSLLPELNSATARLGNPPFNIRDPQKKKEFGAALGNALERNPEDPTLLNMDSTSKMKDGDYAGARASAAKAVANGGGSESLANLAAAESQLGEYEDAQEHAAQALEADPNNQMAAQTLKFTQGRTKISNPSGGGSGGSTGGAGAGGGAGGWTPNGTRRYGTGVTQTSRATLQSAELINRAKSALKLGDYNAAVSLLSQAIKLDPTNINAYRFRAQAFNQLKRFREALADSEAGLMHDPNNVGLLNTKAFSLNRLKDYRGAHATAQRALALDPKSADAYANLAYSLGKLGDRQGMLDNLKRAAAIDPNYQASLDMAVQAPSDSDILFLFPGESGFETAQAAAPSDSKKKGGLSVIALAAAAGGFLIALGLLRGLAGGPWQTLRSKFSRATSSSPAVSRLDAEETGVQGALTGVAPEEKRALGGQYDIIREIGAGGMGMVYEGRDRGLQRQVAIKKMRPEIRDNARERKRFLVEAKTVAALKHPGIVEIFSIMEEDGEVYLVFEYVEGKTFFELGQKGLMPFPQAVKAFGEVASALDYAHSKGVIHRDLKPSNIMLDEEGKARVMDYGVARVAKDAMTRVAMTQTVMGTPPYMAPEQEQGVVSPQGDTYSMAICLYEALSGRLPFVGTGSGLLMNKMSMSYKPISQIVPGLPAGIDAVFAKAFATDLAQRYAKAQDLIAAMKELSPAGRV